ncbi:MAG: TIGR02206 family membrane protein [Verrucomicrobiota bacterium]
MPAEPFQSYSLSHWIVITLLLIFLTVATYYHRRNPESRPARLTRTTLLILNLTACLSTFAAHWFSGLRSNLDTLIPFHFCDVMAFVGAAALITRKPLLCETTYYLGLGATLQGLLTPNLQQAFPHPVFFSFFQLHFATVATALFLPLALQWRPRRPLWKTTLKALLLANTYLLCATLVNLILGTNFAFLMHKPENPSLFDHLGPHPWYLLSTQLLALLVMTILSLPFLRSPPPR